MNSIQTSDIRCCHWPAEETNFPDLVKYSTTRLAIHAGDGQFLDFNEDVYYAFSEDMMKSEKESLEFLLDHYWVKNHYIL